MEFEMEPYIVYAQVDDQNRITDIVSSEFITDPAGWVEIDRGFGDKYHHASGNYFEKPIVGKYGICRYKLADGKPVERTQEEMDADWEARPKPVPKPSDADRIDALEKQLAAYEAAYLEGVNEV